MDTVVNVVGKLYHSSPIKKGFATKPLPTEKSVAPLADEQGFVWKRSMSQSVSKYKIKIKKGNKLLGGRYIAEVQCAPSNSKFL